VTDPQDAAAENIEVVVISVDTNTSMTTRTNSKGFCRVSPSEVEKLRVGVIDLGPMGVSISACLLAAGHPVVALSRNLSNHRHEHRQVETLLRQMAKEGLLRRDATRLTKKFAVTEKYDSLQHCQIVIESIMESVEEKKAALRKVEEAVSPQTIIGTNTSTIPVTILQEGAKFPERILGIHWAEPAHVTRFVEIICGRNSSIQYAERVVALATHWGKEPSLLRKDIRGSITNRLMYALLREAFHLVESGSASIDDIDRSMHNEIPAYTTVMRDLRPELSCATALPPQMKSLIGSGARGVANERGFYKYTPQQARRLEKRFLNFIHEIRALALKYPEDVGNKSAPSQRKRTKAQGRRSRLASRP
jgi:3-hydroxybutyryl-CoA dehydrogenase